eukprot:8397564-Pyramimonas_sp.AAC.2
MYCGTAALAPSITPLPGYPSCTSPSLVTGDHSIHPVPPLRTAQLDSWSVVGAEALSTSSRDTKRPPRMTGRTYVWMDGG